LSVLQSLTFRFHALLAIVSCVLVELQAGIFLPTIVDCILRRQKPETLLKQAQI
jgi:hypothetical protein